MAMTVLVLELQGGKKIRMSLMSSLKVTGAENPHFHVKMAMTVLVLELQGGKKIRMSLMSSLKVYKI